MHRTQTGRLRLTRKKQEKTGRETWRGKGKAQDTSQSDICFELIKEWRGDTAAGSLAGAIGAPSQDLKMINLIQDSVPNPFEKWMVRGDRDSVRSRIDSVTPQDNHSNTSCFSCICALIVSVHVWVSVFWRFLFVFAQKKCAAWNTTGRSIVHKVQVIRCYSEKKLSLL